MKNMIYGPQQRSVVIHNNTLYAIWLPYQTWRRYNYQKCYKIYVIQPLNCRESRKVS